MPKYSTAQEENSSFKTPLSGKPDTQIFVRMFAANPLVDANRTRSRTPAVRRQTRVTTPNQVAPAQHQSNFVTTTTTQSQAQSTNVSSTKGMPSDPSTLSGPTSRSHTSQKSRLKKSCRGLHFTQAEWSPEWSQRRRRRNYKSLCADLNCSLLLPTPISSEVNKTRTVRESIIFHATVALCPGLIRDPLRRQHKSFKGIIVLSRIE